MADEETWSETEEASTRDPRLPIGIKGLGPEGTFLVADDEWYTRTSDDPATTDQLPMINEGAEDMQMGEEASADVEVTDDGFGLPEFV